MIDFFSAYRRKFNHVASYALMLAAFAFLSAVVVGGNSPSVMASVITIATVASFAGAMHWLTVRRRRAPLSEA